MPAVRNTPVLRAIWRFHRALLRVSGGRLGRTVGPPPGLVLETTREIPVFELSPGG